MFPHERSLVKQLADKPFALVGVNSDRDLETIRETVKKKNLNWRSFQNDGPEGKISEKWKIKGWPTIFILDAEGKIRFKGHGGDIDSVIEECLAELGHEVEIKEVLEEDDSEDAAKSDDKQGDGTP